MSRDHTPWWLYAFCAVWLMPAVPEYICVLLCFAAVLFAMLDCRAAGRPLTVGKLGPWLLIYALFLAVTAFFSGHPLQTLATAAMWGFAFGVYVAVCSTVTTRQRLDTLLSGIGFTAGALGLLGVLQHLLNQVFRLPIPVQLWHFLDRYVYRLFPMELTLNQSGIRAAGTFNNPNVYACYLIMAIPLLACLAFREPKGRRQRLFRLCMLCAAGGVAFSFSRSAYVALICTVLVLLIFSLRRGSSVWMSILALILLIPESVARRFTTFDLTDPALVERLRVWLAALRSIARYPLLGLGGGIQNVWDMLLAAGINAPHAHSLLLELMCEGGVFALTLLTIPLVMMWRHAGRLKRLDAPGRLLGISLQAFLVAFLSYGLTDFPLLAPKNVVFFLIISAVSDQAACLYGRLPNRPLRHLFPLTTAPSVDPTQEP